MIRRPKVRITDYRPRTAPAITPKDAAEHDRMVSLFDPATLRQMEADLGSRRLQFAGSPENRWAASRLDAIRRHLRLHNLKKP